MNNDAHEWLMNYAKVFECSQNAIMVKILHETSLEGKYIRIIANLY